MGFRVLIFRRIALFKYFLIFFFSLCTWQSAISQVNIDSLKNLVSRLEGSEKIEAIQELAFELYYIDLQEYHDYSREGFELALALNDSNAVASFLIDFGYYYKDIGDYEKALENFKRARTIAKIKQYPIILSYAYTALGTTYLNLTAYDSALVNHTKSLKLKEEMEDSVGISVSYNNIGLVYYRIGDQERAQQFLNKSLRLKLQRGDTSNTIANYVNLGLSYSESGLSDTTATSNEDYQKAVDSFLKANQLARKYHSNHRIGQTYNGLARVFIYMEEYDSASYYLDYSNQESVKNQNKLLESSDYNLYANIAFHQGYYDLAIDYLDRSQKLLNNRENKVRRKNNYRLFSEIYEAKGLLDSAFYYQTLFIEMKDSIFRDELARNIANLQIASVKAENEKVIAEKDDTITKSRSFNLFLLAILALSVALVIVIFRSYSQTSKINKQLQASQKKVEAQKENLQNKNKQLHDAQVTIKNQNDVLKNINVDLDNKVKERTAELNRSNKELAKAVKDLDQFIYKTSHDLRGPIATMQGIINLGVLDAIDDKSKEYFNTLHKVSANLNNVLFRLIEVHETYQKKPIVEELDPVREIKETTERISNFLIDQDVKIETELKAVGKWKSDKVLFNIIIENMVRNAILYRDGGDSMIKVKTKHVNDHLIITIEDNGMGIQQGDEQKVFNIFFKGSPRPGGTGLEVYTSKIAAEKLGGVMKLLKSMKNTIFEVSLPTILE